uniref:C3H1-type domain-containing protein n=1 Tax=Spongospora subterranea TaxID=70186 RepID=A0A0H5R3Y8_9EUKA|eukprot:CRZ08848.1 hypothetical protein [Spongospora subterranea]
MASLSQLRWSAPAWGQMVDTPKQDPWSCHNLASLKTPIKRPGGVWDEMNFASPIFGLTSTVDNNIWRNEPSPVFGESSPARSVISSTCSPMIESPNPRNFSRCDKVSVFRAPTGLQSPALKTIADARDDPYPIKEMSSSSLPIATRHQTKYLEQEPVASVLKQPQKTQAAIGISHSLPNELVFEYPEQVNDLWSVDQAEDNSCEDGLVCVDSDEQLLKTELCRNWGPPLYHCQYGDTCNFAHGEGELRERVRRGEYKSKLCDEPVRLGVRSCTYTTQQQSRCNYCHPGEAVRQKCSRPYFDSEYFAILAREFPGNSYPFGIFL